MGEQSRESEVTEPASYNPFLEHQPPLSPAERMRMIEEVAMSRKLIVTPQLRDLVLFPEVFYQKDQQSGKMAEDAQRRRFESFNTKRESFIRQKLSNGLPLPSKIQMIDINPTRVTLCLEVESQYYHLMTTVYGDHENLSSIMAATNTLIQLPDHVPSGTVPDPFVQQVSITGLYSDVERARMLMRENCHVSVFMSLSEVKCTTELESIVHQNSIPNVQMQFCNTSPNNGNKQYHLRFTARSKHESQLITAADTVMKKYFEGKPQPANQFSLHFTLSTSHIEHVLGHATTTLLMPQIESMTKTTITCPSFDTREDINRNICEIVVTGEVKNVLEARKYIIELLPVFLCFNMKETDMAAPSEGRNRVVTIRLGEKLPMLKLSPSKYEPAQLLKDEVPLHSASLGTKEFNIKSLYAAYKKWLSADVNVVAPQPETYDNSVWHTTLPLSFYSISMQCRGETPDSVIPMHRTRTTSVTSCKSKRSNSNRSKMPSESSGVDPRSHPMIQTPFENPALQAIHFANYGSQWGYINNMIYPIKGTPVVIPYMVPHPTVHDMRYVYHPELRGSVPENAVFAIPHQINEVEQVHGSTELAVRQQLQTQRKNGKNGNRNGPAYGQNQHNNSNFPRTQRVYEHVKEDDARSSTKPTSRRTSVSGDEPTVGSYEDRGQDRSFHHRQYQRYQKEEPGRYKAGSRGDMLRRNVPQQKEFRGNARDNEYPFGSLGSVEFPPIQSVEHRQFQTTHHLKLKQNEIVDLENERLFTHDNSMLDEQVVSPRSYAATVNSSFEHEKRSRTPSAMEKEDPSSRFPDSEYDPMNPQRRLNTDKKDPPKIYLAKRNRPDRNFVKTTLEHKDEIKYFNEPPSMNRFNENKYVEKVKNGTRINPLDLIASVHEASEQLPIINERQFNDVLNDKERELAAASMNPNGDSPEDPSFDDSTSMNYAFREKSCKPL